MKTKSIWSLINTILVVTAFVVFLTARPKSQRIVYVDNARVFQNFNMTKELGEINEKKFKPELERFDSLVKTITEVEGRLKLKKQLTDSDRQEYENIKRLVLLQEERVGNIRLAVKEDINKQVWQRLNGYMKDYGDKEKFSLILGAQGSGNIMYGDSIYDVTRDFIKYANYKYEGN